MNDIPATEPSTMSVYLAREYETAVELPSLKVTQVTVLAQGGALLWVDPIGHVQIGEQVLRDLITGTAERIIEHAEPGADGGA